MANSFPIALSIARDLALTLNGDLVLGPDGDLDTVTGEEALLQEVIVRLKTKKGDARYAKSMGASLDTMIGQPLSPQTGVALERLVMGALTHDGLFTEDSVSVIASPDSDTTIVLQITCSMARFGDAESGEILSVEVTFDLQEGLLL